MIQNAEYAGFWQRFFASLIDTLILAIPANLLLMFILWVLPESAAYKFKLADMLLLLTGWIYYASMESSAKQATYGKIALKIKVTDINQNRITFGKASLRFFGRILCILTAGIGFLIIPFTSKKQGLHDLISECLVIKS